VKLTDQAPFVKIQICDDPEPNGAALKLELSVPLV
jgi:hypothetical protein